MTDAPVKRPFFTSGEIIMGNMLYDLSKYLSILLIVLSLLLPTGAHATFSIVAVDTITGAVGGAGASCIAGAQIINDIIEGVGAVHTQAYYIEQNQDNAHALLAAGHTPDSIISWLYNNDYQGNPWIRQYGVVTLAGPGSSAAHTGSNTDNWKGHRVGPGYAIQGNILLSEQIVDTMEYAYLNTPGPLEDRLMAALEAANVPGADTRCMSCNKPAISAFIKVVQMGDGSVPYLYQVVNNTICAENPVDSLRVLYDLWIALPYADPDVSTIEAAPLILPANEYDSAFITVTPLNWNGQTPAEVTEVALSNSGGGMLSPVADNGDGTYSAVIISGPDFGHDTLIATVTAGGNVVDLTVRQFLYYFACGDMNGDEVVNIFDITGLIGYLYLEGAAPDPIESGDANGDGLINIFDITYIISYLYLSGPEPDCYLW
jgi:uncharacterized Ntn-hydrolase superfamily protein